MGSPSNPAGEYVSLTRKPITNFITDNVPAPTQAYISADAFLHVQIQNLFVGLTVNVSTRVLRADDGAIITSQDTLAPTSDGAINSFNLNLTEGFLLSVVLTTPGVTASLRGVTYCSVMLAQGTPSDLRLTQLLIQDYMQGGYGSGWPGGLLRSSIEGPGAIVAEGVPGVGAGAEVLFSLPQNVRLRLISFQAQLVTSAVVANRLPRLRVPSSISHFFQIPGGGLIPANTTATITWAANVSYLAIGGTEFTAPIPADFYVDNLSGSIGTSTAGLDAGDQYSNIRFIVEQWIRG